MRDIPCANTHFLNQHLQAEEDAYNACPNCADCGEKIQDPDEEFGEEVICRECVEEKAKKIASNFDNYFDFLKEHTKGFAELFDALRYHYTDDQLVEILANDLKPAFESLVGSRVADEASDNLLDNYGCKGCDWDLNAIANYEIKEEKQDA